MHVTQKQWEFPTKHKLTYIKTQEAHVDLLEKFVVIKAVIAAAECTVWIVYIVQIQYRTEIVSEANFTKTVSCIIKLCEDI